MEHYRLWNGNTTKKPRLCQHAISVLLQLLGLHGLREVASGRGLQFCLAKITE